MTKSLRELYSTIKDNARKPFHFKSLSRTGRKQNHTPFKTQSLMFWNEFKQADLCREKQLLGVALFTLSLNQIVVSKRTKHA